MGTRTRFAALAGRILGIVAIGIGTTVVGGPGPAGAAPVAPAAACSGTGGVTVVVDFGSLGGGTQTRCAPGDPGTGLDALTDAGFSVGFVPNAGPFVCTIDQKPNPCNRAPSDAYWAYWYAEPGAGWTYSNAGAASRDPSPGAAEGWVFGNGTRAPSAAPPPAPTTTTTARPAPTAPAATPPAPSSTASGTAPPTSSSTTTEPGDGDAAAADPDASTTTTDDTTTTSTRAGRDPADTTASTEPRELAVAPSSSDGGSGAGALVGVVLVVALGAGAAWELRRRRTPS